MTYDRKIFMIPSLQIGHNQRVYTGDNWLMGSNVAWGRCPMLAEGIVNSNLVQILLNATGAGGSGWVSINGVSEMQVFVPNGTTGIFEETTSELISAGDAYCLLWTETAFSGSFDGNMIQMGVYT
jgi:hypothetical protein